MVNMTYTIQCNNLSYEKLITLSTSSMEKSGCLFS